MLRMQWSNDFLQLLKPIYVQIVEYFQQSKITSWIFKYKTLRSISVVISLSIKKWHLFRLTLIYILRIGTHLVLATLIFICIPNAVIQLKAGCVSYACTRQAVENPLLTVFHTDDILDMQVQSLQSAKISSNHVRSFWVSPLHSGGE